MIWLRMTILGGGDSPAIMPMVWSRTNKFGVATNTEEGRALRTAMQCILHKGVVHFVSYSSVSCLRCSVNRPTNRSLIPVVVVVHFYWQKIVLVKKKYSGRNYTVGHHVLAANHKYTVGQNVFSSATKPHYCTFLCSSAVKHFRGNARPSVGSSLGIV